MGLVRLFVLVQSVANWHSSINKVDEVLFMVGFRNLSMTPKMRDGCKKTH